MPKIDTTISDFELKTNKATSSVLLSGNGTHTQYPNAASVLSLESKFIDAIYPVDSIYKTTDTSFNPTTAGWAGTWTIVEQYQDRIYLTSTVIHPGLSGTGQKAKTKLIGCYDRHLFGNLYAGDTTVDDFDKAGYNVVIRGSAMISTGGQNQVTLYLNGNTFGTDNTWSSTNYRVPIVSTGYIPTNIAYDSVVSYESTYTGINLCYQVTNPSGTTSDHWNFWDVCIHAYLEAKNPTVVWKRIA